MNKFIFLFIFLVSVSFISAYNVGDSIPLSVHVQYDNGISLSNVPIPCRLSIFNNDLESFTLRNVSMIPSGAYHLYSFVPSVVGSYTASVLCSYSGDSSVFWFDFDVSPAGSVVPSGAGRGIANNSGSVLQSVLPSGSILPERSTFTVNKLVDTNLKFSTQYYVDSKLANAQMTSYKLLDNGNTVDSGSLTSTSVGTYVFSYDFTALPVGSYQVALNFDGKPLIVDVSVVSNSNNIPLISGMITGADGTVSTGKLAVFIFVLLFVVVAIILLFRSIGKKPSQHSSPPRRETVNR